MLTRGDSGVGGVLSAITHTSNYARIHLHVYEMYKKIITSLHLIISFEITGNNLVIDMYEIAMRITRPQI